MMNKSRISCIVIVWCFLCGMVSADVIYREVFPNNAGSNIVLSTSGWQANNGSAGAAYMDPIVSSSAPAGGEWNLEAVNSFPASSETKFGFLYNNQKTAPQLMWTDEVSFNLTTAQVTQVSWYQNDDTSFDVHFVIQVNGNWFASSQTYTQTGAWVQQTLDFTNATWRILNFVPDSTLSLGAATTLTVTQVEAIGFFAPVMDSKLRLDTVEIQANVVPEPVSVGLFVIGSAGLVLLRRSVH